MLLTGTLQRLAVNARLLRSERAHVARVAPAVSMRPAAAASAQPIAPPGARLDPSDAVLQTLRETDAVAFDVDSTLCEDESIDELAAYVGAGTAVAALTKSAMGGTMSFQEALQARLELINVSHATVEAFLADHPPRLSPGIPELVQRLQELRKDVFLVSGGFRPIINPIAEMLGIPLDHVYANTILYQEDGSYAGFDAEEFTSRSGGKAAAVKHIKEKHSLSSLVMIGDGATDLEARQPGGADLFIGCAHVLIMARHRMWYGGTVARDNVAVAADWFVYRIDAVLEALQ